MAEQPSDQNEQLKLEQVRGVSYRQLIETQLAEERATKASLEQRGLAVVTTSGVLATLLFGLAAFAKQSQKVALGAPERYLLLTALLLFVGASAAGLWVARPRAYREAKIEVLYERVTKDEWYQRDPVEAYRRDAQSNVFILETARTRNGNKAKSLFLAISLEVLAVACVAAAVGLVVYRA